MSVTNPRSPWRKRGVWLTGSSKPRPKHNKPATCEVCGLMPGVHDRGLVYDHNHGTGEHRGWLCNGCNSALGLAGDNPEVLRALAAYLDRTGCHPTRSLPDAPRPSQSQPLTPSPGEPVFDNSALRCGLSSTE